MTLPPPWLGRRVFTPAVTLCLLLVGSATLAQMPGLPGTATPKAQAPAKAEPAESADQQRARVRKLLDEAREQAERTPEAVPDGIEPRETIAWRDALLKLTVAYDIQLRALEDLAGARAARQTAEARERDWTGFDVPPPYSILRIDELRDVADLARDRIGLVEAGIAQLKLDAQREQDELKRSEAELRRAEEALAAASSADDKARATWRRDLARLKSRSAAASAAAAGLLLQYRGEDLLERRAELKLVERQITVALQHASFTDGDVATARKRLEDRAADARGRLAALSGEEGPRLRERDAAQAALAARQAALGATAEQRAAAEARLTAADAWISSLRDQADALRGVVIIAEEGAVRWGERFAASHAPDAESRRRAAANLREALDRIGRWKSYAESLVRESQAKLADVEARLTTADLAPEAMRYTQDALAARRQALLANERLETALDGATRQLGRWVGDLNLAREQQSFGARARDAWLALRDDLQRVWNFEIFDVEDTTVVDGQPVTISRGVTLGKSVGAFLVFLIGYWVVAAAARRIEKRVVARGFDAPRVRTTRRWVVALSAVMLALLTLNLAHIPFTVFAFLGGALAIGVGFGAQTLIKNLISGMVVLMERQVKVGDIVEVDNITGTVTEVNLRSSTVRGFDGVESIVPNASFLEHKVTNWTGTDRKVRRVVKVGVAYGSPVREVADILLECAGRHGLVLRDPAPMVIFEDFGDSALVFALYLWVELGPNVNSLQVMSDLRFMIEKRFAEAGIVIAYPQRDLHLDAAKPLQVEVVGGSGPGGAAGASPHGAAEERASTARARASP